MIDLVIKRLIVLLFLSIAAGCQSPYKQENSKVSLNDVLALKLGETTKTEVKNKFGSPDNEGAGHWEYHEKSVPKTYLSFEDEKLSSIHFLFFESDNLSSVEKLLLTFRGRWRIIKEPFTNPHSGPNKCYLEDLSNGRRIEINAYRKEPETISIWKPKKTDRSIRNHLMSKVGKEYCIGSSCSRVTDPNAWKANQCKWLEDIVKAQKGKSPSGN